MRGLNRQIARRPVLERSVIQQDLVSERSRSEQHSGRLLSDVAVADHGITRLHASPGEECLELGGRLQQQVIAGDLCIRNAFGTGSVSGLVLHAMHAATRLHSVVEGRCASIDN